MPFFYLKEKIRKMKISAAFLNDASILEVINLLRVLRQPALSIILAATLETSDRDLCEEKYCFLSMAYLDVAAPWYAIQCMLDWSNMHTTCTEDTDMGEMVLAAYLWTIKHGRFLIFILSSCFRRLEESGHGEKANILKYTLPARFSWNI